MTREQASTEDEKPPADFRCVCLAGTSYETARECDRPAVLLVTSGCVHEHISTIPVCEWHDFVDEVGPHCCADCAEMGDDSCPRVLIEVRQIAAVPSSVPV